MYREMIQLIPQTQNEVTILEIAAGSGVGTSRFRDELIKRNFNYFLDIHDYYESNRFYLSMIVSPMQLFITSLEKIPKKKYNVILLSEGVKNPKLLENFINEKTIIIIRYPKLFKRNLEKFFICSQSFENHWYFGVYKCYLKSSQEDNHI